MPLEHGNLFTAIPSPLSEELVQELQRGTACKLERIVSLGHATPKDQWYDQEWHEWVVLLSGSAGLRFEDEDSIRVLHPGDWVNIPAHKRHRVEWTDAKLQTVWLALHYAS